MKYLIVEIDSDGLMISNHEEIETEEDARLTLAEIKLTEPFLNLVIMPVLS